MNDHGASVWRACTVYFKSDADREDAYQEAFLKYALADTIVFTDEEHKKAWLIRVATNVCKDMLKSSARKNVSLDDEMSSALAAPSDPSTQPSSSASEAIDALRTMSDPPKTPLYLAICEGFTAPMISKMLDAPVNTVYSWIARGKKLLREALT